MGLPVAARRLFVISFVLLSTLLRPIALADNGLEIGGKLPVFAAMPGVDGQHWKSEDFREAAVLIVAFTCNRCLYAIDYEERLTLLYDDCQQRSDERVQLLVINSNHGRDESLAMMKLRSTERKFGFPYVKDEEQSVARAFGAVYTPEFFVFDQQRRLAYKGAMDDATKADAVTVNYVQKAVEALTRGESIETAEVGARGCTIRFRRRPPAPRTGTKPRTSAKQQTELGAP